MINQYAETASTALCRFFHRKFCVITGSGTSALYLAFSGLGLQPGSSVVFPSMLCETAVNAAIYAGMRVIFCDVVPETCVMSAEAGARAASEHGAAAVIPVHLFGSVVDSEALERLTPADTAIVEDAAQAYGGAADGKTLGGGGRVSVVSFGPGKLMDCGGGGALFTDDEEIFHNCLRLEKQLPRDEASLKAAKNAFMADMYRLHKSSASGNEGAKLRAGFLQQNKDAFVRGVSEATIKTIAEKASTLHILAKKRREQADTMFEVLHKHPLARVVGGRCAWAPWRLSFQVNATLRDDIYQGIVDKGIKASRLFDPQHRKWNFPDHDFPGACLAAKTTINIPFDEDNRSSSKTANQICEILDHYVQ